MEMFYLIIVLHMTQIKLEQIHHEAARIITGTTKLVCINKLMTEVCWDSLETMRYKHKFILFFKRKTILPHNTFLI